MYLDESKQVWSFGIISFNSQTKAALPVRCIAIRCNNTGDRTCINMIQTCIKSHFSVLSLSYDVKCEPVNFGISGTGVTKKFRLENLL